MCVHLSLCWCVHDCQPVRVDIVSACFPGVFVYLSVYVWVFVYLVVATAAQSWTVPEFPVVQVLGAGRRSRWWEPGEEAWAVGGGEECVCALSGKRWMEEENRERR